jgi:hypothetical protein
MSRTVTRPTTRPPSRTGKRAHSGVHQPAERGFQRIVRPELVRKRRHRRLRQDGGIVRSQHLLDAGLRDDADGLGAGVHDDRTRLARSFPRGAHGRRGEKDGAGRRHRIANEQRRQHRKAEPDAMKSSQAPPI